MFLTHISLVTFHSPGYLFGLSRDVYWSDLSPDKIQYLFGGRRYFKVQRRAKLICLIGGLLGTIEVLTSQVEIQNIFREAHICEMIFR